MARPSTFDGFPTPRYAVRVKVQIPSAPYLVDEMDGCTIDVQVRNSAILEEWRSVTPPNSKGQRIEMGWADISALHGKLDKLLRMKRQMQRRQE